jgi:hypothetical protein
LFAVFSLAGVRQASADLPALDKQPWFGHFAVYDGKRFQIGMTSRGGITLYVKNEKDAPMKHNYEIKITIDVEETLPDGKTSIKRLKPESLESAEPASADFEKAVIRGKVTGDAAFELTLEQNRGVISFGGRIPDPGTLTKNPVRFVVSTRIPNIYSKDKKESKKEKKAFEKKMKGDRIEVKWTDGKRMKQNFEKTMDAAALKELNGPGIAGAEIEMVGYKERKLLFLASPNSSMKVSNEKGGALHEGFTLTWGPDAAKDPEGKARLSLQVK